MNVVHMVGIASVFLAKKIPIDGKANGWVARAGPQWRMPFFVIAYAPTNDGVPSRGRARGQMHDAGALPSTVAILAQGTSWADAFTQAFLHCLEVAMGNRASRMNGSI